jgi:hypothetical protein
VVGDDDLLRGLDPDLVPGRFVFVSVPEVPLGVDPVAMVVEPEGRSLVLPAEAADSLGLRYDFEAAMITLRVHSALDAVGLTAAVSSALATAGIACNVIAGYHHDHLFVPYHRAREAVTILGGLA